MIKDTDGHSDEEIHRARSGRVLSPRASVPVELRFVILPVCGCVTNLEALWNLILLGFLCRPHVGMIDY